MFGGCPNREDYGDPCGSCAYCREQEAMSMRHASANREERIERMLELICDKLGITP